MERKPRLSTGFHGQQAPPANPPPRWARPAARPLGCGKFFWHLPKARNPPRRVARPVLSGRAGRTAGQGPPCHTVGAGLGPSRRQLVEPGGERQAAHFPHGQQCSGPFRAGIAPPGHRIGHGDPCGGEALNVGPFPRRRARRPFQAQEVCPGSAGGTAPAALQVNDDGLAARGAKFDARDAPFLVPVHEARVAGGKQRLKGSQAVGFQERLRIGMNRNRGHAGSPVQ